MINTTSPTHVLFLDLQEVEAMENTELVVNRAEKCPTNPALPLGDLADWDRLRISTGEHNCIRLH